MTRPVASLGSIILLVLDDVDARAGEVTSADDIVSGRLVVVAAADAVAVAV
eukprot:CAMPEP_0119568308 /NCGR_PEP_ID=MMETSP1352-20130426/38526_1 /TAXON_ID=265584 /ORGANISM="Stauroneis constricta, Strain CCMP1120" /LENGTH=50 /DNA_ID=CAMNT_0007617681 /DNA_START=112 /DNA_END=261 /DNA_ORIENTATION=+